jgi:hypothetical protein
MTDWQLVPNPAWAGKEPSALKESDCHDRSHFITIQCEACHDYFHVHQTQVQEINKPIGLRCVCGTIHEFPAGFFERAFENMRRDGWIA